MDRFRQRGEARQQAERECSSRDRNVRRSSAAAIAAVAKNVPRASLATRTPLMRKRGCTAISKPQSADERLDFGLAVRRPRERSTPMQRSTAN